MKNRKTLTIEDLMKGKEMLESEPLTKIKEITYCPHPLYIRKTYVLTLAKTFMKGHPKAGEPTNFKEKYLNGEKIHTIRAGEYWRKVVEEVNAGRALLSVREWSGKPYASKQVEIAQHFELGYQDFAIKGGGRVFINGFKNPAAFGLWDVAKNDGLQSSDFEAWFNYPKNFTGGIIHFTSFRYA